MNRRYRGSVILVLCAAVITTLALTKATAAPHTNTPAVAQRVVVVLEADVTFPTILTHQQHVALRYSARQHHGRADCSIDYCMMYFRGVGEIYRDQTLNPNPALLVRPDNTLAAIGFDRRNSMLVSTQFRWHAA